MAIKSLLHKLSHELEALKQKGLTAEQAQDMLDQNLNPNNKLDVDRYHKMMEHVFPPSPEGHKPTSPYTTKVIKYQESVTGGGEKKA